LGEVHSYLVTGNDEQRYGMQMHSFTYANWIELRGQTALVTAFDEHLDGFLKLAAKCGATVQRIENAGDDESYTLLVGEEKDGWTDRRARDWAGQQLELASAEHDEFVNAILEGAPDEWDGDEAAESIALGYVHHLEAQVDLLGGSRAPESLDDGE
jgi:hypothetical protein